MEDLGSLFGVSRIRGVLDQEVEDLGSSFGVSRIVIWSVMIVVWSVFGGLRRGHPHDLLVLSPQNGQLNIRYMSLG